MPYRCMTARIVEEWYGSINGSAIGIVSDADGRAIKKGGSDMSVRKQVEVAIEVIMSTDKALLVSDGGEEVWIAISHIKELEDVDDMEEAISNLEVITIPEWVAIQKGLI